MHQKPPAHTHPTLNTPHSTDHLAAPSILPPIPHALPPTSTPPLTHPDPPSGGYCLLAALIQGFGSYPFHDPVLTDRAFLAKPRVMLASFLVGGCLAILFIVLFSAVGIADCYVKNEDNLANGLPAIVAGKCGKPADLGRALGSAAFTFMNLVMMTSSMSTLDSTFTSVAKLAGLEFAGYLHLPGDTRGARRGPMDADNPSVTPLNIAIGRLAILMLAVVGTLNLLSNTEALSATTVSGTMVMGQLPAP